MNQLGSNYVKNPVGEIREIFMDDIINASANAVTKLQIQLNFDDKSWETVYHKLIEVLSEVCGEPDYRNYN